MQIKILFIMVFCTIQLYSQTQSILIETVSLNFTKAKTKTVFKSIQDQSGAIFSYSEFNDEQLISIKVEKVPLRDVIRILESELHIVIIAKEKYLIVKNNNTPVSRDIDIKGTISNASSDDPMSDVSVYVKKHKILVNTGKDGRFAFRVPSESKQIIVNIAKENYIDTSLVIVASKNQHLHIKMRTYPRQRISVFDSLTKKELVVGSMKEKPTMDMPEIKILTYNESFWEKQKNKNVNLTNITDTLFNSFSISLLPPISTNKLLSFHTKNTISINIIGGHSKGLNGAEVGGVYNYDDGDVYGVQVAGVVNAVSKDVIGTQISGVMNAVKGNVTGVQIAGVFNNNDHITDGIQMSGVYQKTHTLRGLQIAGLYNRAIKAQGSQISGLLNTVDSATTFLQIAGLYNHAANIKGVQISGLVNTCDTLSGLQIGIFNRANCVKNGLAIGLVNYVINGYHKMEISHNDLGTTSIGYRSGWAPLHIHYFFGYNGKNKDFRYIQSGIGLASSVPLSKTLNFEADANIRKTNEVKISDNWQFNMHNQLMLGFSWQPVKKIGIRTGITLNHLWYDADSALQTHIASSAKNDVYTNTSGSFHHKVWVGWQVGLVLF